MQHQQIASFIWNIANDVLRDDFTRGKYRDVILPMTVIRRLDCLLEPTKDSVLKMKEKLDASKIVNQEAPLRKASGYPFYNISKFTLRRLLDNPKQLKANFKNYLDGFSENVQDVIEKFKFRNQIVTLDEADILGLLIEKFTDPSINLSPKPVLDSEGNEIRPGLHNHAMGTIFEELIRRFNEENNEEAGEHFTPRDVVELMAKLILLPVAKDIKSGTYLLYDGACGTGGMLTVAEETLQDIAKEHGKEVAIHLHGQEVNPEIYAITKSDLLIKGEGEEADNIIFGSTLSADGFASVEFDFMISNPPYGKDWKKDLKRLGGSKDDIQDPRFIVEHNDDPEFKLIPAVDDGQMLFLVNMLSKMKEKSATGSRIAEVHNGSSLFTGDAGSGESNVRRWIIENDWLEAIIALPSNIFYNTGIATYIWVLTNKKSEKRKGKVQLLDGTKWFRTLRKNLGEKRCELNADDIKQICDTFLSFEENEYSKIFPNEAFGYKKITVLRPLRLSVTLTEENLKKFDAVCAEKGEKELATVVRDVAKAIGSQKQSDLNTFFDRINDACEKVKLRFIAKRQKLVLNELAEPDDEAVPVIRKKTKIKADTELRDNHELYGEFIVEEQGRKYLVEYEPSKEKGMEQISFLESGGIEGYFKREVLPYVSDAWIDDTKVKIGYEIQFTRHFYKYETCRELPTILQEINTIEKEAEGLLDQITKLAVKHGDKDSLVTNAVTKGLVSNIEMKDSGIAWIGQIPKNWSVTKFKGIFTVSNERVKDNPAVDQLLSVSGYRGIEKKDVSSNEGQMPSEDISQYRIVRPGQLVVNTMWLNYAGLGVSKLTGYVSPAYRAYDIDESMEPRFVHYLMRSFPYVQKYSSLLYGIRPNSLQVKPYDFEQIQILVPPKKIQQEIADYLDKKCMQIDSIIRSAETSIEKMNEYRQSLISDAITGKPDIPPIT